MKLSGSSSDDEQVCSWRWVHWEKKISAVLMYCIHEHICDYLLQENIQASRT